MTAVCLRQKFSEQDSLSETNNGTEKSKTLKDINRGDALCITKLKLKKKVDLFTKPNWN